MNLTMSAAKSRPIEDISVTQARQPILEISNVSKRFGDYQAVHPLDLKIDSGEFITLLGPSGCGKTTLLRMISGLERPTTGTLTSESQDLTRLRPEKRPFNMVFQSYALFPHLNVFDNVAYGLRAAGLPDGEISRRVEDALEMVGLAARRDEAVGNLSGGMSQRVALVRAIVNQPRILLLDEPLAALDLQLRKKMQVELRDIQQKLGTTFILVTHDQEESLVMSDRIVVMQAGRVEQIGTPREIYHMPQTRFVADFIGETSLVECVVTDVQEGGVQVCMANGTQGRFSCHSSQKVARGDSGAVSLRPEQLRIVPAGEGQFQGTVTSQLFVGSSTRVTVKVNPDMVLHVAADGDQDIPEGWKVGVAILDRKGVFIGDG